MVTKECHKFTDSAVRILVFLSVICIVIGCSSKKDETNAEKSSSTPTRGGIPSANSVAQEVKPPILTSPDTNQVVQKPKKTRVSVDTLLEEFNTTSSSERKVAIFRYLPNKAFDHDPCVVALVQMAVADNDGNVVLAAVEAVQGCTGPNVMPVIAKVVTHPSEEVRQTAMSILADIDDPQIGDLLGVALSDESEDVRDAAIDATRYKDEQVQLKILEKGISSPSGDIKEQSVAMLEDIGGHLAVDILIEALQDKDAEFRETVASSLNMLIDQEFTSYEEAKKWWNENKNKYDEELSLKE